MKVPIYIDYVKEARKIPSKSKVEHLLSLPEVELHEELKSLFEKMEDKDLIEMTHGNDEYGRDLVIEHKDPWGKRYIGVVVKKGDASGKITGKSAKVVDEIIMQTREALSQPCPLHEISTDIVRISEIRVIFVGKLTTTAVMRVVHEVKTAYVQPFAIGWLTEKFTEYYPEVFFQGKLAEYVKEQILILETKRESLIQLSPLSMSFISPWVSEIDAPSSFTQEVIETLRSRRLPFQDLEKVVEERKRVLLIGDPGTGKTTALAKIALDMFEKCIGVITSKKGVAQLEIPILIKASDLLSKDIEELIETRIPAGLVRERVKIRAILVDGLDEVKVDKRADIARVLDDYCQSYAYGLVISTRKVEALKDAITPFKQYELLPFEYKQAIAFVQRFVKDAELLRIIDEGLRRKDLKMSLTPMALELLIQIATVEKEIPATITEIFERFTDGVLGRFDAAKGIMSVFEYFIKKRFLAELAWSEFYLKDRLIISRKDFDDFVQEYAEKYGKVKQELEQFLSEIVRAGILQIGDSVYFRHRSFLEFSSAFRLAQHRADHKNLNEDVANIHFDLMWTEIAFFYIGILREVSEQIVQKLDEYDESSFEFKMQKALIGRLLQAGWDTPSEIKLKAMEVALRQIKNIRHDLDSAIESTIKSRGIPIPAIFPDFFLMSLAEYSFGSITFLNEVLSLCNRLSIDNDHDSLLKCLLLLWANRRRLTTSQTKEIITSALSVLSELEKLQKLTVRDKYINLFMLQHIEEEDTKLLKHIGRKMNSMRRLYPSEMRRLLPKPGVGMDIRVKGRRKRTRK